MKVSDYETKLYHCTAWISHDRRGRRCTRDLTTASCTVHYLTLFLSMALFGLGTGYRLR